MKHINITNWQGNITDWTKFNYIYGGVGDNLADKVNLSIKGTNLRNYIKKSDNLLKLQNVAETTIRGITYSVSNGVITLNGTATANGILNPFLLADNVQMNGTFTLKWFSGRANNENIGVDVYFNNTSLNVWDSEALTRSYENVNLVNIVFYIAEGWSFDNLKLRPMLVKGSTVPTTYEPYDSMVMVENVGTVDLGSLEWVYRTTPHVMQNTQVTNMALPPNNGTIANISCTIYKTDTANNVYNNVQDKTISVSNTGILQVYDSAYTDATTFKSAMNGVYLTYELATPKITIIHTVTIDSDREPWETRPNYTYADRFVTGAHDMPAGANGYVNWYGFEYYTNASSETYPYVANNNGRQIIVNFSAKGTTTLAQFKEYVSKNPLIITWWEESTTANTLSMVSPMQLEETVSDKQIEEESVE